MPLYERVDALGEVVERVQTIDGSTHDTELGVAVIDGTGGWRLACTVPEPEPQPAEAAEPDPAPDTDLAPSEPTRAPRARRPSTEKE